MATSSVKKGNQYEKEVRDILIADGWLAEGQHRQVMYIRDFKTGQMRLLMKGRDIYGCDLIAKKRTQKTKWIQVSTVSQKSSKEKQVRQFTWNLDHEDLELWLRIDGKRAFRRFVAVKVASQDPTFEFTEIEPISLPKKEDKDEKDTDGPKGLEGEVASEYPE